MHKYGILGIGAILIVGALGIFSALQEWWVPALLFAYGALVVTSLLVLACTRYIARLLRTEERKSRAASKRWLEDANGKAEKALSEQRLLMETSNHAISAQGQQIADLDSKVQKTSRTHSNHVTRTVRHSTSEIESLLQIFLRFSDMKLPMPSTGGWALDAQSLAHLISVVEERRPRRILELGSGTSTIWLGYLCRSYGGELVTLDHLEEYLKETRSAIDKHGLNDVVESRLAPLEEVTCDGDIYNWYSVDALSDLSNIDMVLIDGPPAGTGPKARYPALPMIIDLLSSNATVILDDAHRPDEVDIIDQWLSRHPDFTRTIVGTPGLAILSRST